MFPAGREPDDNTSIEKYRYNFSQESKLKREYNRKGPALLLSFTTMTSLMNSKNKNKTTKSKNKFLEILHNCLTVFFSRNQGSKNSVSHHISFNLTSHVRHVDSKQTGTVNENMESANGSGIAIHDRNLKIDGLRGSVASSVNFREDADGLTTTHAGISVVPRRAEHGFHRGLPDLSHGL